MTALVSFAQNASAHFVSGEQWPLYQRGSASSALRGDGAGAVTGPIPKLQQLAVWDGVLGY